MKICESAGQKLMCNLVENQAIKKRTTDLESEEICISSYKLLMLLVANNRLKRTNPILRIFYLNFVM